MQNLSSAAVVIGALRVRPFPRQSQLLLSARTNKETFWVADTSLWALPQSHPTNTQKEVGGISYLPYTLADPDGGAGIGGCQTLHPHPTRGKSPVAIGFLRSSGMDPTWGANGPPPGYVTFVNSWHRKSLKKCTFTLFRHTWCIL